jgi:hypothetical protein
MRRYVMNKSDANAELVEREKTARRHDFLAIQSVPLRVENGVSNLERLTIETMQESILLLWRLESCEPPSVIAWPRTIGRRMPESRANAS